MFSFFFKKARLQAALFALLPVLLTGLLAISCEQPAGSVDPVDANAPAITVQPQGGTWDVSEDDEFTLIVTANSADGGELSYQWYKNTTNSTIGGDIAGTTNPLTLEKEHYIGDGDLYFYVVVTNTNNAATRTKTAAATSGIAKVTVSGNGVAMVDAEAPKITGITTNPAGGEWDVTHDDEFTLTVTASVTDGGTLSYRWYKGDDPIGEDDKTLTLNKNDYHGDGDIHFHVVVTNTIADNGDGGTKTATAASEKVTVTVSGNGVAMVNAEKPEITVQPSGGNWNLGNANTFTLTVTANSVDDGTLSYQWYRNSTDSATGGIAIGTDNPLTLAKADYEYNAPYYFYVVVTNTITENHDGGVKTATATSDTAAITISGGSDAILIYTTEDMAKIGVEGSHPLSAKYLLMNDITLEDWPPIGDAATPFTGLFDGGGNKITLNSFDGTAVSSKTYLGIFGYVKGASASEKVESRNLTINSAVNAVGSNTSTTFAQAIGLLTGYAELAEIENITLTGTFAYTSPSTNYVGGIVGLASGEGTLIKNSTSTLTMNIAPGTSATLVTGVINYSYVGGFVGIFNKGPGIENCHYTGNITADDTHSGKAAQIFVGGIAGGSSYLFNTAYNGYIKDSSFTGTVIGKARGSWTFAGGIAGAIVGDGNGTLENTTRIERCFAKGTVSVAGTSSGFPYIGGIVGYNYYGALVSQSYFDGDVIADKTNDYTGGIAGYNSQTSSHNSRIEDCWSGGTVTGFNNAGGIVGVNQTQTYIRRSYSLAALSITDTTDKVVGSWSGGVGGITGFNASMLSNAITACVALNSSLSAAQGSYIQRIVGRPTTTGTGDGRSNNHAWSGMTVTTGGTYTEAKGADATDGEDCAEKPDQVFYEDIGWDFANVWKMGADGYPQLKWQK